MVTSKNKEVLIMWQQRAKFFTKKPPFLGQGPSKKNHFDTNNL
jgi:hypothetical protein